MTSSERPTTVQPAGPFGGNSQSGRTAQHGTQSGYVMHRRHDLACERRTAVLLNPVCTCDREACQPCKDAHAAYVRLSPGAYDRWVREAQGDPYPLLSDHDLAQLAASGDSEALAAWQARRRTT